MQRRNMFTKITLALMLAASAAPGQDKALGHYQQGIYYYNNDDVTDAAAREFKRVITQYPDSKVVEDARFYLANYYQRKFYVLKDKSNLQDQQILQEAKRAYSDFIVKYVSQPKSKWLSDAYFCQAIVFLEQRELARAKDSLAVITMRAQAKDPEIYIYQLVWSRNFADVIDGSFNAAEVATYLSKILMQWRGDFGPKEFAGTLELLRDWCKSQKTWQQHKK